MKHPFAILLAALTAGPVSSLMAQSNAITYQGSLAAGTVPSTGAHNMTFTLKDAATGGNSVGSPLIRNGINVTNGNFSVELDFGSTAFAGGDRWLEISVNGTVLAPRQKITPSPRSLNTRGIKVSSNGIVEVDGSLNSNDEAIFRLNSGSGSWIEYAAIDFQDRGTNIWGLGKSNQQHFYIGNRGSLSTFHIQDGTGRVGIGTSAPANKLHLRQGASGATPVPTSSVIIENDTAAYSTIAVPDNNWSGWVFARPGQSTSGGMLYSNTKNLHFHANGQNRMSIDSGGRVSVGTAAPEGGLSVTNSGTVINYTTPGVHLGRLPAPYSSDTVLSIVASTGGGAQLRFYEQGGDNTRLWYDANQDSLKFDGAGLAKVSVPVLEIRGGADIVEGFDSVDDVLLEPGTVVSIDPENPGALMRSSDPYDLKVAGIVSGAGGVNPGMHLGQDGVLDGDTKVAMTGRVYVKASGENGPIRPGDRLTTASLAGHAMKATDSQRSDGTVIGKAMTPLDEETGLVLVLVNLQ